MEIAAILIVVADAITTSTFLNGGDLGVQTFGDGIGDAMRKVGQPIASNGVVAARLYLYLISAIFLVVGMTALLTPMHLAAFFELQAQTERGVAEIRSLYGGLFLFLGALTLYALRRPKVAQELLVVVGALMGSVAAARIVSMVLDREISFTLPAAVAEAFVPLACWTLVRAPNQASAGGRGGQPSANIV